MISGAGASPSCPSREGGHELVFWSVFPIDFVFGGSVDAGGKFRLGVLKRLCSRAL